MRFFGLTVSRTKALNAVSTTGGWWPLIRESFAGAWQRNIQVSFEDSLSYWPVFRCVSLISNDIAKLGLDLVEEGPAGVWNKTTNPAFSPVLRRPNRFQNRIQFYQSWLQSTLTRGNAYVLKQRDDRRVVVAMYVLDPSLVKPLVADDGSVFYQLSADSLSGIREDSIVVPASEIIHDRWNTFYHPLCGLSPLYAAALKAGVGLRIENANAKFFEKGALPSGILTAPGAISDDTAKRLKDHWDSNYSGANAGKVAVLGDNLKFERMSMTAEDTQLIEQLKWTVESIAGVFGVPLYMLMGQPPTYNNVEALTQQYYSQCLQILIESIELLLNEGLGLNKQAAPRLGTMFDLDDLLRMDTATQTIAIKDAVGAGVMAPNEGRRKLNMGPVPGGESPYLQEQNWPLRLLADRELPSSAPTAPAQIAPPANAGDGAGSDSVDPGDATQMMDDLLMRVAA